MIIGPQQKETTGNHRSDSAPKSSDLNVGKLKGGELRLIETSATLFPLDVRIVIYAKPSKELRDLIDDFDAKQAYGQGFWRHWRSSTAEFADLIEARIRRTLF